MGLINDSLFEELMTEESEFAGSSTPATNNPSKPWDAANSKEKNISVKGGTGETPSAKPYDGEHGPKPSGLGEKPSGHMHWPERGISVPSAEMLQDPTYNKAIKMLQKSFESVAMSLKVVDQIQEQYAGGNMEANQDAYTEAVLSEAMVAALDDGPYFESLDRDDKDDVKRLVKKMRGKLKKLNQTGIKFYDPAKWVRLIGFPIPQLGTAGVGNSVGNPSSGDSAASVRTWFNTRMWSIVGAVLIDRGSANEFASELNKQFADELGEYKFLMVRVPPTLVDIFRMKFGWKNTKGSYFILIDKKLTSEIKKAIASMKAAKSDDDDAMEESAKEEKKECDCGKCEDCKKRAAKQKEEDDEDLKVEAALDDFFAEGFGARAAGAVKQGVQQAAKGAVVAGAVLGGAAAGEKLAKKISSLITKLSSKYVKRLKGQFAKYKKAKESKDFQTMRELKSSISSTVDQMMSESARARASMQDDPHFDTTKWDEQFASDLYERHKDDPWYLNCWIRGFTPNEDMAAPSKEEFIKLCVKKMNWRRAGGGPKPYEKKD